MSYHKTAITIPSDILGDVDRAARARGESRSRYIAHILRIAVRARRDAEITRRLNELFAEPGVRDDQLHTANDLDRAGTDWSDEKW